MIESILSKTNLPNLHPAFVHFPIVLFTVAFAIDLFATIATKRNWLRKTASLLYVIAALSAGATYWTGRQAADSVDLPAKAQAVLARHENLGLYTLIFFGVYGVARIGTARILASRRPVHFLLLAGAIPGLVLVTITAEYGGTLVYKHAVAVNLPQIPASNTAADSSLPEKRETPGPITEGQNISWTFGPGSERRLLEFMEVAQGPFQPETQAKTEAVNGRTVVSLDQKNRQQTILTFKPVYGAVQIEGDFDLSDFQGTVALVHHLSGKNFDFFRIENKMAQLGRREDDMEVILADKQAGNPTGIVALKAVGASGHFRGYINGKLVVHGHEDDAPAGKAGILFDGTGTIRIARIAVHDLAEEEHKHMKHE